MSIARKTKRPIRSLGAVPLVIGIGVVVCVAAERSSFALESCDIHELMEETPAGAVVGFNSFSCHILRSDRPIPRFVEAAEAGKIWVVAGGIISVDAKGDALRWATETPFSAGEPQAMAVIAVVRRRLDRAFGAPLRRLWSR